MNELFTDFSSRTLVTIVDILLVTFLIFRLLLLVRGQRAWRVVIGIAVFVLALWLSDVFGLRTLNWLLDKASLLAPVALVILLLPELRQAIEGMARLGIWSERFLGTRRSIGDLTLEEIVRATQVLSGQKTGAIIIIERNNPLDDVASTGIPIQAKVSAPLLESIFYGENPLHDGAIVIRFDRILAGACRLPLSESQNLSNNLHMRHRAAVGITEQSDALALVVSEERGTISICTGGVLTPIGPNDDLREILRREVGEDDSKPKGGKAILTKSAEPKEVTQ
ncbi:MAG: diadenylate cyclase CdaA [Fimbriimonadaceae bacterium]|nr:diadenylate cyclase CdaA [Fimbriimonadaceae bacterium]